MRLNKRPIEVLKTEALLKRVTENIPGAQVNGRQLAKPDTKLYEKMKRAKQRN